jgi:hypothetical protein
MIITKNLTQLYSLKESHNAPSRARCRHWAIFSFCIAAFCVTTTASQAAIIFGDTADMQLTESNVLEGGPTIRAGSSSGSPAGGRNALFVFQLPDFGTVSDPFLTADLGIFLASRSSGSSWTASADVYGLGRQSTATLAIGSGVLSSARHYELDTIDPNATLIMQDFSTGGTAAVVNVWNNTDATGDANLVAFLNAQYAGGAGANEFVVFRINPDTNLGSSSARGYNYSSADVGDVGSSSTGTGTTWDPVITFDAVPEPSAPVMLLGGLTLLGLLRRYSKRSY